MLKKDYNKTTLIWEFISIYCIILLVIVNEEHFIRFNIYRTFFPCYLKCNIKVQYPVEKITLLLDIYLFVSLSE